MDFGSHISLREPPCNHHPRVSCISLFEGRSLSKQLTILYVGNVAETDIFILLTFSVESKWPCSLGSHLGRYQLHHLPLLGNNTRGFRELSEGSPSSSGASLRNEGSGSPCIRQQEGRWREPMERGAGPKRENLGGPEDAPLHILLPFCLSPGYIWF